MGPISRLAAVSITGLALVSAAHADTTPRAPATDPFAGEAAVIEKEHRKVRFEDDGTGTIELTARVRIVSEAGLRQWGQLVLNYNAAYDALEFRDVRVIKPKGAVAAVPLAQALEVTSPVAQSFPIYTDQRQKHLPIPGLAVGDVIEYTAAWTTHTPLAPGHFWYDRSYFPTVVSLDDRVEVSVPRQRVVQIRALPEFGQVVSEEGGRRVYLFTRRNADPARIEAARREAVRRTEAPAPEVNLSSFASWDDLGAWYRGLERDRRVPTAEIRARAAELTRGLRTDLEKVEALYAYVATRFRYVSVSLGAGAVQPHAAAQTLANGYGDCKDKHTLFAALLESAGIEAHTALISLARELDPTVPSLQFDHVITAVRLGNEYVWADTTTEVAPFRWLAPQLRGKKALVVPPRGPARLVETPSASPIPSEVRVEAQGTVDASGKLTMTQRETYRGDLEVSTRMVFRVLPAEQHKLAAEMMLRQQGNLAASPEGVTVEGGDPARTGDPYEVRLSYAVPRAVDLTEKMPVLRLPDLAKDLPDATAVPLRNGRAYLGGPWRISHSLRLDLPEGWSPADLPTPPPVKESVGEYTATYRFEGRRLSIDHNLTTTSDVLAPEEEEAYDRFRRAVRSARTAAIVLRSAGEAQRDSPAASAKTLYDAGLAAYRQRDFTGAADKLKRAVELVPDHQDAWNDLGRAYIELRRTDDAIAALRRQVELVPAHRWAHNNLGRALRQAGRLTEAEGAFKRQIEINAEDGHAHRNLGALYVQQQRFGAAVAELEKAATLDDSADLQLTLADAYLGVQDAGKAMVALEAAVSRAPEPLVWNNAAWRLAVAGKDLERAQAWAESAVATSAARLRTVLPDKIGRAETRLTKSLSSYWDTLGWIHFRRGDARAARPWLEAAFAVVPFDAEVAEHVKQLAAPGAPPRLPEALPGIEVPRPATCSGACQAAVLVALASTGKISAVAVERAIDGAPPDLQAAVGLAHGFPFPDATPTQIVLPAAFLCPAKGACRIAFMSAKDVLIVN